MMETATTQFTNCVIYEELDKTTNSVFEIMVTKIVFGNNTATLPNLTGLMIGNDRGYLFRDFIAKIMDAGTIIYSTLKRYPWVSSTYDQHVKGKDRHRIF